MGINSSSSETFPDLGTGEGSFVTPIYLILWCCRGNIKTGKEREGESRGAAEWGARQKLLNILFSAHFLLYFAPGIFTLRVVTTVCCDLACLSLLFFSQRGGSPLPASSSPLHDAARFPSILLCSLPRFMRSNNLPSSSSLSKVA